MRTRRYSELCRIETFEERFEYLNLNGQVGDLTFGSNRWINQRFYASWEWQRARRQVILRDNGCDLGVPGHEVRRDLLIHHMNPVTVEDLTEGRLWVIDPEFLICTSKQTHNAIHYGDASLLPRGPVERRPGDT